MAAINIDVGANTRQAERDIQKLVNRSYNINLKTKGDQPLGRITGKVNEFTKSLDASNARVIAFGASAGIIFGVQRAFTALASSVIETQKALQDINVILNVSSSELNKFGSNLFNIAKNTGQSFQEVAKAATEFSRQGLGVAETLKRTNEALILSRLSGLDTVKSVEALTAAVNSFAGQAVTATEVVNKFANVDAAFAVSSADLAEAISRVGSSAAQSGVSLNELISIVTAAQQTTARGGAVIGNSFKTIFTRLQRTKVVNLLEGLGIDTRDASGEIKSTINLLTDLAKVYDQLGTLQQAEVAEKVGGVFQINILKAALADLGKEYSIYNNALQVAASTTDQAIRRNEELNKTYAAQLNALRENARQAGASVGERLFGPAFDRVVGNANDILGSINESDGEGVGAVLGKGILDGLGQVIAGPGLALIGGIFIKLFSDLAKFATGSLKELLNLNAASKQQQQLQESVAQILQKNPELFKLMQQGTAGLNKGAEILLNSLRAQTLELQKQEAIAAKIAAQFIRSGSVSVAGGVPVAKAPKPGKAAGFIPNFASDRVIEKYTAISLGASSSVRPKMSKGTIGGKKFVMNNQEVEFPNVGRNGDSMVIPLYGGGDKLLTAMGFIPNFAQPSIRPYIDYAKSLDLKVGSPGSPAYKEVVRIANRTQGGKLRSDEEIKKDINQLAAARKGTVGSVNALKGANKFAYMYAAQGKQDIYKGRVALTKDSKPVPFNFSTVGLRRPYTFEDDINEKITPVLDDLAAKIIPEGNKLINIPKSDFNTFLDKSAFNQIYGRLFEAVINRAIGKSVKGESGTQRFEFFQPDLSGQYSKALNDIFSSTNLSSFAAGDLKFRAPSPESASVLSFVKKMAAQSGVPYDKTARIAAQGFIPNFAAIQDGINREMDAGIPKNQIYLAQENALKSANPAGLGVFNKLDEPNKKARKKAMRRKGFSSGYIPNFASEDTQAADLGSSFLALGAQIGFLGFGLQGFGESYKKSLTELTTANQKAGKVTNQFAKAQQDTVNKIYGPLTREQTRIKESNAPFGPSGSQKAGAAIGAAGIGLTIAAPIIAETIANAIGKETKEARVGGSYVSAAGQAASFAGLGAMLAPNPLIGAAIGGAAGGLLGLIDVIKQASTDIPELSEAAKKASENLTKINDAGQKVQTSFEQIRQLREGGQAEKAGKLEAELLSFIRKEFKDTPELVSGASVAVINQDFDSLQQVIGENTLAIQKNTLAKQRELVVGEFLENLSTSRSETQTKRIQEITGISNLEKPEDINRLSNVVDKAFEIASKTTFGRGRGQKTTERAIAQEYVDFLESTGASKEEIDKFRESFRTNPSGAIRSISGLKDSVDSLKEANEATARILNNPVIKTIVTTLQTVQSNYAKLAKQTQSALDLQLVGESSVRKAQTNIGVSEFETKAVQEELFGITTPRGQADSKTRGELLKIEGDFDNTVKDSVGETISLIGSAFLDQQRRAFGALSKTGTDENVAQKNAEANLETARALANKFLTLDTDTNRFTLNENFTKRLEKILGDIGDGFDVEEKLGRIAQEFGISEGDEAGQKTLDQIRDSLNKNNNELIKSRAVLIEQKTILANQKFQESLRELITSINSAFGGLQAFINKDTSITRELDKAVASLKIIGPPEGGEKAIIEYGRNLQRVVSELSKITGRNLGAELGQNSAVISAIREARALDIEKQLTNVIRRVGGIEGEAGKEILEGFRRSIAEQIGEPAAAQLTDRDLIKRYSETVAKQQIEAENKVGEINQKLIDQAKSSLPPELQKLLGEGDENALALLAGDTNKIISLQFSAANKTLRDILAAIKNAEDSSDLKIAKFLQDPFKDSTIFNTRKGGDGSPIIGAGRSAIDRLAPMPKKPRAFAAGSIPPEAIPAMMAEQRDIKKGVGGARPSDRPVYRNDLGIVVSNGEKVYKNFMGTGKPAVFNRDMQRAAEGIIPNFAEGSPEFIKNDLPYSLVKQAHEINQKYKKEFDPIEEQYNRNSKDEDNLIQAEKESFYSHMKNKADWDQNRSEKAWKTLLELDLTSSQREAKLKEYYGWESPVKQERIKVQKTLKTLRTQKNKIKEKYDTLAQPLSAQFDKFGVSRNDFLAFIPSSYGRRYTKLSDLFEKQETINRQRRADRRFEKDLEANRERRKKMEEERAKTQEVIRRGRETLARSYDRTGDRYEIDEYGGEGTFTVDAQRLGLRGPGAGGTFNIATSTDRAGIEPTTEIRRAERTTQANAKFMLQSLIEAYTEALSGQEGFYNRPTRQSMDQKRALTEKVREFKRLYEQGRYESLREIYEKHEKNDPVKQAYEEWNRQGIDPDEGYERAMAYAREQEALYQKSRADRAAGLQAGYIDGRPAQEVLAEISEKNRDFDYENAQQASFSRTDKIQELADAIKSTPGAAPFMYAGDEAGYDDYLKKRAEELGVQWYAKGFIPPEAKSFMEETRGKNINSYANGLFPPEAESIMREMSAGFRPDQIYPKTKPELQGLDNPLGKAYFNKPEEKNNPAIERMAMTNRMYTPNFANSVPESSAVSVSLGGITINEAQTGGKTQDYAQELSAEIEKRFGPLVTQIKGELDQKYGRAMEMVASAERQGKLPRVPPRSRGLA